MEKENIYGIITLFILDIFMKDIGKAMGNGNLLFKTTNCILANSIRIKNKVKENTFGRIDVYMKAVSSTT